MFVEPLWQEPEAPLNNATSRGLRARTPAAPGDCKSRDSRGSLPLTVTVGHFAGGDRAKKNLFTLSISLKGKMLSSCCRERLYDKRGILCDGGDMAGIQAQHKGAVKIKDLSPR